VAAGMCMAADLAQRLGWLGKPDVERIVQLVRRARLPVSAPGTLTARRLRELMSVDKKVEAGKLRLVVPKGLGQSVIAGDVPAALVDQTLEYCREGSA